MAEIDLSTLESRPPWRIVMLLKLLVIVTILFSVTMLILGAIMTFQFNAIAVADETPLQALYGSIGAMASDAAYIGIEMAFFGFLLWLAAQAVDRLDQLVWLKANQADREFIYNQRNKKKKNAKNQ